MSLITIVVVLIVVGVILWLINTYIPMQGTIKSILNAVVVIVLVIWLLQTFGVLGELGRVRVGGSDRSPDNAPGLLGLHVQGPLDF
jgi:hypothetical protein